MRVPPRSLLVVVPSGPLTRAQREERHLIDHVPQRRVAGEAEVDDLLLAAPLGHGHGAGVRLQMLKRLPPLRGVPQAGPERGRVIPWSPIGSVRIHCAAGRLAKKSSTAFRESSTPVTTGPSLGPGVPGTGARAG